ARPHGGEGGIRTHGRGLPYTRFPGVLLRPLGHLSRTLARTELSKTFFRRLPQAAEEAAQQVRAFYLENPAPHLDLVVEPRILDQIPQRAAKSRLGILGAEHQRLDPAVDQGAGTHGARLERDVHRTTSQAPV